MGVEAFQDAQGGQYEVNWDGVQRIIRSYARSSAVTQNTKVVREHHWIGPDVANVNVDWARVRSQTDSMSKELYARVRRDAARSMKEQAGYLRAMAEETAYYNDCFHQTMRDASHETMGNINRSVARGERAVQVAEFTRDLSAETLIIGSTLISGGATLGFLAAGSGLKGVGKWQDTGSWQNGVFTASTEVLFGALRLKVDAGVAKEAISQGTADILTMIVLPKAKAGMEVLSKTVVEGKSVTQGVISGALKSNDPGFLALAKRLARPEGGKGAFIYNGLALLAAGALKLGRDKGVAAVVNSAAPKPAASQGGQAASHPAAGSSHAHHAGGSSHVLDAAVFSPGHIDHVIRKR